MGRLDKQRDGEQVLLVSPAECRISDRIPEPFSNLDLKRSAVFDPVIDNV